MPNTIMPLVCNYTIYAPCMLIYFKRSTYKVLFSQYVCKLTHADVRVCVCV